MVELPMATNRWVELTDVRKLTDVRTDRWEGEAPSEPGDRRRSQSQGRSLLPESSSSSFSIFEASLAIRTFPASTEVENEDDDSGGTYTALNTYQAGSLCSTALEQCLSHPASASTTHISPSQ
jgi:hypothetical protein